MHPSHPVYFCLFLFVLFIGRSECYPLGEDDDVEVELPDSAKSGSENKLKQEDLDDDELTTKPYAFGQQVAQIVTGALTGDLGSILQGSFNLVPNQENQNAVNEAWATIAGIPKTPAPTPSTAAPAVIRTEPTTPEPAEPVETETEGTTVDSQADESSTKATTPTSEDDDEDEDAEEADKEVEAADKTVYSRSKVLRVI